MEFLYLLLRLYWAFFQIGATAFGGGYAALPLIQQVIVNQNHWLNMAEMTDIVSISQMTPGPIAINAASFVGMKVAGPIGSVVATVGNVTPQFILMMILGTLLFRGRRLKIMDRMLKGLRPGVVGLIGVAALTMLVASIFPKGFTNSPDWIAGVCLIVGFTLYLRKVSLMKLIGLGAVLGVILQALEPLLFRS